ncbi:GSCOCG00001911001-RA-CDS [Cotesia congregata]|nr:GSCOCG00001911001-RA-CDS [Cotesia congregata]
MSSTSSSDNFSPKFVITCRNSIDEINPSLFLSNTLFTVSSFHFLRHHL